MTRYITLHSRYNLLNDDINSKENYYIHKNEDISNIPKDVQNLFILDYGHSLEKVDFPNSLTNLKSITIGPGCFENTRELLIDNLPNLESVIIGYNCFSSDGDEEHDNDGICQITNCPKLRKLQISYNSFEYFKSLQLYNLDSLLFILFDDNCFKHVIEFVLKGE